MSHYIERWECGHVASQCRCPGPKEERTRPGKCSTCAAQVSAMPERVWEDDPPVLVMNYPHPGGWHDTRYVPESRLLAAEARVREMEADVKAAQELEQLHLQNLDSAYAERDALVPLAWWGLQEALGFVPEITPPTDEQIAQARAILAREAGE